MALCYMHLQNDSFFEYQDCERVNKHTSKG